MEITKEQLKQMQQDMKAWGKASPNSGVEISPKKMTKALEKAGQEETQHEFDKKVIIWFHIVKMAVVGGKRPRSKMPTGQSMDNLFEIMRLSPYRNMFDRVPENWETDEKPTKWMREVYRQFLEYDKKATRTEQKYGVPTMRRERSIQLSFESCPARKDFDETGRP